jgi:hypothetical protein
LWRFSEKTEIGLKHPLASHSVEETCRAEFALNPLLFIERISSRNGLEHVSTSEGKGTGGNINFPEYKLPCTYIIRKRLSLAKGAELG